MIVNKPVDRYAVELELLAEEAGGRPIRAIATNLGDESFAEAWLTVEEARSLLMVAYGAEQAIVDEYMGQLREHHSIQLAADSKSRCIFTSKELVGFGFNPDDLKI